MHFYIPSTMVVFIARDWSWHGGREDRKNAYSCQGKEKKNKPIHKRDCNKHPEKDKPEK